MSVPPRDQMTLTVMIAGPCGDLTRSHLEKTLVNYCQICQVSQGLGLLSGGPHLNVHLFMCRGIVKGILPAWGWLDHFS